MGRKLATDSFGSGRSVATRSAASVRARERLLSLDVDLCLEVRERPVIGVDRSLNRKIAAVAFGSVPPVRHHDKLTLAPLPASIGAAVY